MQAHGAAHMNLVGGDANFRAQAVFKAIGKARGGIDHHACAVHRAQKLVRAGVVFRDDGVGVVAAVRVDVDVAAFKSSTILMDKISARYSVSQSSSQAA